MKIIQCTGKWGLLALMWLLIGSCEKKPTEEILPLDESSGAPLVTLPCGAYRTFSQLAWDQSAAPGPSPGRYRDLNFEKVFLNSTTNGLVLGIVGEAGRQYLRFTSAAAIQNFLPQTAPPAPLTLGAENPPAGAVYSAFAGEVAALKLNLYYDDYEHFRTPLRTGKQLRYLLVAGGLFQDLDVERLLATAERVLGGDPSRSFTYKLYTTTTKTYTFTLEELFEAVKKTNEAFDGGIGNSGYLDCQ